MRVVFDTNIIISGRLWAGAPQRALKLAEVGQVTTLISEVMIDELKDVLSRPKFEERLRTLNTSAEQVVIEHLQHTEIVEAEPIQPTILADPDNDIVLSCAFSGTADYVVSGDPHLLAFAHFQAIPILSVHDFLALFTHS